MDDDSILGFWRDRAKLVLLSPEYRLRGILYLAAAVFGIGFLLSLSKWRPLGMEELTVQAFYAVGLAVVLPSLLAVEMFYKGGRAALDLKKDEGDKLADQSSTLSRVENEFTRFRIAKEQEVKDLERERGVEIATLQAKVAALESKISAGFDVETTEKRDRETRSLNVNLVVHNRSPMPTEGVTVLIKAIEIVAVSQKRGEAEIIIDRLVGKRLAPRIKDSKDHITVSIPGHSPKEFFFVEMIRDEGIHIVNELSPILRVMTGDEIIQGRLGTLPSGTYRVDLVVSARDRGALCLSCHVCDRAANFGCDLREVIKP